MGLMKNNYNGGMIVPIIRKTKTLEVEMAASTDYKDFDGQPVFPTKYRSSLSSPDPMHVYDGKQKNFNLILMRDGRFEPIDTIPRNCLFMVLEVKRGNEY